MEYRQLGKSGIKVSTLTLGTINISIVGSPQQIADYIVRLHQAGVDGVQLSFFDFQPDLDFFGERVLPLLREAGLRY